MTRDENQVRPTDVAVIAMTGRFPGARGVEELWELLRNGVDAITDLSTEELRHLGLPDSMLEDPRFVKTSAILEDEDVETFDAEFFKYSPREAALIDPQQRLFLQCAWEAMERAGYATNRIEYPVGVWAGQGPSTYLLQLLGPNQPVRSSQDALFIGNDKDFLATRVSYELGLMGPSMNVQSACSTSLVATHLACQSLLSYECDMALAGGINITVPQRRGYLFEPDGPRSEDGRCRAFDADAQGTMLGNGVGVVVLKRLSDALADGDRIHAVIRGSAVGNDGDRRIGYRAPGVDGQAQVISAAQANAEVHPASLGYVETHGTATPLGDPIEVKALTRAFHAQTDRKRYCAIGSVKTNLSHLGSAAGVTGLIKAALIVEHGEIPPSLHFRAPNPEIDFENSPLFVNRALRSWDDLPRPRRAGVSSFGLGGTNAHMILEQPPAVKASEEARPAELIVLSAKSPSALDRMTERLAEFLRSTPEVHLPDAAFTLQVGRNRFGERLALVSADRQEAADMLESRPSRAVVTHTSELEDVQVGMILPGLGDHYPGMGGQLYREEPTYRRTVDRCAEILTEPLGFDLRDHLLDACEEGNEARGGEGIDLARMVGRKGGGRREACDFERPTIAHPALFVTEYALSKLWEEWGVAPAGMLGYSLGEWVSACLGGVFTLPEALHLVAARARLMEEAPEGGVLVVSLSEEEVADQLDGDLSLSAVTGPSVCAVAGPAEALDGLERRLSAREVVCRRLPGNRVYHSRLLEPQAAELERLVAGTSPRSPRIPFISNVTGDWIRAEEARDPAYWARQMVEPVQFYRGVQKVLQQPWAFLELGPGGALGSMLTQVAAARAEPDRAPVVAASLPSSFEAKEELFTLLRAMGKLWTGGVTIDWRGFHEHYRRLRTPLPTYPFARQRCWIDTGPEAWGAGANAEAAAVSESREPPGASLNWPVWRRAEASPRPRAREARRWLVLGDRDGVTDALAESLVADGDELALVVPGEGFRRLEERCWSVSRQRLEDYLLLVDALREEGFLPTDLLHLWSAGPLPSSSPPAERFARAQERGLGSIAALYNAFDRAGLDEPLRIWAVATGLFPVESGDRVEPEKGTLLGLGRVLPQEDPRIAFTAIDLDRQALENTRVPDTARRLAEILTAGPGQGTVVLRGRHVWRREFEVLDRVNASLPKGATEKPSSFLLVGSPEGLVLDAVRHLSSKPGARVIVLRPADQEVPGSPIEIPGLGAGITVRDVDLEDREELRRAIADAVDGDGQLDAVLFGALKLAGRSLTPLKAIRYEQWGAEMAETVRRLYALDAALSDTLTGTRILFSSLASILGGAGHMVAASLGCFLDAFAHSSWDRATPWIALDWDAVDLEGTGGLGAAKLRLSPQAVGEALDRVLAGSVEAEQVIVCAGSLEHRLALGQEPEPGGPEEEQAEIEPLAPSHGRGDGQVLPENEIEALLVRLCTELLGAHRISVQDDFFELGGHSLVATRLLVKVREALGVELSLDQVYESPILADLAVRIEEAMIEQLEDLDEEEAERRLSS